MKRQDFSVLNYLSSNFLSGIDLRSIYKSAIAPLRSLSQKFNHACARCIQESTILYDGVAHATTASAEDKVALERDLANIVTETTLSVVEGAEFEICALVAAVQAGEKIAHHDNAPMDAVEWRHVGVEAVESLCSSPAAAAHACVDLVRDLERTGQVYRATKAAARPSL